MEAGTINLAILGVTTTVATLGAALISGCIQWLEAKMSREERRRYAIEAAFRVRMECLLGLTRSIQHKVTEIACRKLCGIDQSGPNAFVEMAQYGVELSELTGLAMDIGDERLENITRSLRIRGLRPEDIDWSKEMKRIQMRSRQIYARIYYLLKKSAAGNGSEEK